MGARLTGAVRCVGAVARTRQVCRHSKLRGGQCGEHLVRSDHLFAAGRLAVFTGRTRSAGQQAATVSVIPHRSARSPCTSRASPPFSCAGVPGILAQRAVFFTLYLVLTAVHLYGVYLVYRTGSVHMVRNRPPPLRPSVVFAGRTGMAFLAADPRVARRAVHGPGVAIPVLQNLHGLAGLGGTGAAAVPH